MNRRSFIGAALALIPGAMIAKELLPAPKAETYPIVGFDSGFQDSTSCPLTVEHLRAAKARVLAMDDVYGDGVYYVSSRQYNYLMNGKLGRLEGVKFITAYTNHLCSDRGQPSYS